MTETPLGRRVRQHTVKAFRLYDHFDWKTSDRATGGIPDWEFVIESLAYFFEFKLIKQGTALASSPPLQQAICKRMARATKGRCLYYLFDDRHKKVVHTSTTTRSEGRRTILCSPHHLHGLEERLVGLPALGSQERVTAALRAQQCCWVPGWDYTLAVRFIRETCAGAVGAPRRGPLTWQKPPRMPQAGQTVVPSPTYPIVLGAPPTGPS